MLKITFGHGVCAAALTLMLAGPSQVLAGSDHGAHQSAGAVATAQDTDTVAGEIKRVDQDSGKLTIKHGPIPNLDMPGMTMVFRVAEPGLLDRVKEGDAVRFAAGKINGAFTVTRLEVTAR